MTPSTTLWKRRLRDARVLIVNCTGLAAEIAKNLVLAGVGTLVLADGTATSQHDPGNFLINAESDTTMTVSEASAATLKEMNPLVNVHSRPEDIEQLLTAENIKEFKLVVLVGEPFHIVAKADFACTKARVPFIASGCREQGGWVFSNPQKHSYIVETSREEENGSVKKVSVEKCIQGVSFQDAIFVRIQKRNIKRISPFLYIIRAVAQFEVLNGKKSSMADIDGLMKLLTTLCEEEGLSSAHVETFSLPNFIEYEAEIPPVNSILGGCISNDIIKIVTCKGEPLINNLCLYSMYDGAAWVERLEPVSFNGPKP